MSILVFCMPTIQSSMLILSLKIVKKFSKYFKILFFLSLSFSNISFIFSIIDLLNFSKISLLNFIMSSKVLKPYLLFTKSLI